MIMLGAIALIAYPLFRPPKTKVEAGENLKEKLKAEKEALYGDLKDLEFDFRMGKLSKDDYAKLKDELEEKAIPILKQIEEA
jgi:hypothetical protein